MLWEEKQEVIAWKARDRKARQGSARAQAVKLKAFRIAAEKESPTLLFSTVHLYEQINTHIFS